MCKKMCSRIITAVVIAIALVLSVLMALYGDDSGSVCHKFIAFIIKPFDVMIPVLAAGALIKYLIGGGDGCCDRSSCGTDDREQSCCGDGKK